MEIDIHQADLVASFSKAQRQVNGDGRLADPAFAAHDQDFIFDFTQGSGDGHILLGQTGVT
jgi:hypothetical protein